MMKGSTERWVEIEGKEVCANIFRTDLEFCTWANSVKSDYTTHPLCEKVEQAIFSKTQQHVKMYRLHRMQYVGHLVKKDS